MATNKYIYSTAALTHNNDYGKLWEMSCNRKPYVASAYMIPKPVNHTALAGVLTHPLGISCWPVDLQEMGTRTEWQKEMKKTATNCSLWLRKVWFGRVRVDGRENERTAVGVTAEIMIMIDYGWIMGKSKGEHKTHCVLVQRWWSWEWFKNEAVCVQHPLLTTWDILFTTNVYTIAVVMGK